MYEIRNIIYATKYSINYSLFMLRKIKKPNDEKHLFVEQK